MGESRDTGTSTLYLLDLQSHRTRELLEVFMSYEKLVASLGRRPDFEDSKLSSWGCLSASELANLLREEPEVLGNIVRLERKGHAFCLACERRPKHDG